MDNKFSNPEHELFLFNVLLGRFEMAKIFCTVGNVKLSVKQIFICLLIFSNLIKDSISSALIGKIIFKSYADNFEENSEEYLKFSK